MEIEDDIRAGEVRGELPGRFDASLYFIGSIRTPFKVRTDCPRRGDRENGPDCQVELDDRFQRALTGLEDYDEIVLVYWMHEARRDLLVQRPKHHQRPMGTFALRSPVRPNPIALSVVRLIGIHGATLTVRGLDCLDGTPLIDIKPEFSGGRKRCDE